MSISVELLKDGIEELYDRNKISSDIKSDADDYIDLLSLDDFYEVAYSEFDQTNSTNMTFTAASRSAAWDSGTATLLTTAITLGACKLKALMLKGTDPDVSWSFSTDGSTYYTITNPYDLDETIATTIYIKATITATNTVKGMILIYEKTV